MQEHPENAAEERPKIDLTPALGEAGHEVQELGYEGIPDTAPIIDDHDEDDGDVAWRRLDSAMTQFPID
jgi:hypothetical protein